MICALAVTTGTLHAQSQSELTQDACAKYKKADQTLTATYSKVLNDYVKDPQFLAKLRRAQRRWLAFRDAHLEARFPKADKQAEYGSIYSTCRCTILEQLTEQRTQEVKLWADGIPEGDVCNGSVKTGRGVGECPKVASSH